MVQWNVHVLGDAIYRHNVRECGLVGGRKLETKQYKKGPNISWQKIMDCVIPSFPWY